MLITGFSADDEEFKELEKEQREALLAKASSSQIPQVKVAERVVDEATMQVFMACTRETTASSQITDDQSLSPASNCRSGSHTTTSHGYRSFVN